MVLLLGHHWDICPHGRRESPAGVAPLPQSALARGQTRRAQGLFRPLRPAGALLSSSLVERGGLLNSGQEQFGRRGEARCSSSYPEPASSQPGTGAKAHLSLGSQTGEVKSFPTLQGRTDVRVKPPSQGHRQETGRKPVRPSAPGQEVSAEPGSQAFRERVPPPSWAVLAGVTRLGSFSHSFPCKALGIL